jgi:starch synthase (maltosyl-transferring)
MKSPTGPQALDLLAETLKKKCAETRRSNFNYRVPSLWSSKGGAPHAVRVQPYEYFLDVVRHSLQGEPPRRGKPTGGEWTTNAVIYNMFVRTTTAFDHNDNGVLDIPINSDGMRETGTFLKAMAMLPYIKRLGANTVHLLPITSIGHDGNKGTLGSPYAIRNPYEVDENLSEPQLGLDAKTEFKAFVEAAHRLGLRVVVEFVFRTAAKDGDWVKEHPEWFYWISDQVDVRHPQEVDEAKYGSPVFSRGELERIHADVREGRFGNLIPPHKVYRDFFTEPPRSENVTKEHGRYVGRLEDGRRVKIPGAFADWPPDDNQPPWGDVTYLRMYTHPEFNYIGYNTIRMYDTRLTQQEFINRPLWDRIVGIIPYYQQEFHIDGVMIDMGHALPMQLKSEMVSTARKNDPDFAFWDENFAITGQSRAEGYNAVFGYLWTDEHHEDRMRRFFQTLATEGFPIPYFATPENHNTPRAAARPGKIPYAKWAMVINAFLPGVPFLHSGFELGEEFPINTGLDFTHEDLARLPSEKLPLFSEYSYDWQNKSEFTEFVSNVLRARETFADLVTDPTPKTFKVLEISNHNVLGFARLSGTTRRRLAVVGSVNYTSPETATLRLETEKKELVDVVSGENIPVKDGAVHLHCGPGQCFVFEF